MEYHTVAQVGDIPPGEGRSYTVAGKMIGLFHIEGAYFAINDFCPHMGASLAAGNVEGDAVYCPWHAWRFCVKDGNWLDNPSGKVKTDCYPVRIAGDEIQIGISNTEMENKSASS